MKQILLGSFALAIVGFVNAEKPLHADGKSFAQAQLASTNAAPKLTVANLAQLSSMVQGTGTNSAHVSVPSLNDSDIVSQQSYTTYEYMARNPSSMYTTTGPGYSIFTSELSKRVVSTHPSWLTHLPSDTSSHTTNTELESLADTVSYSST
jgi:hypothetical protein